MPRALVIDHPPTTRPDRVTSRLKAAGWRVARACPGEGDGLPGPDLHDAVVLIGGGALIGTEDANPWLRDEYRFVDARLGCGLPMAGFGLGAQIIAHVMGAQSGSRQEPGPLGWNPIRATAAGAGLLPPGMTVFHGQGQSFGLPFGAVRLAASAGYPNQAVHFRPHVYGFQFRPELPPEAQAALLEGDELLLEESARHDPAMAAWLAAFLDRWLTGAGFSADPRLAPVPAAPPAP